MLTVDLAVYNRSQELVLTAEVKLIARVSENWASQLRRNILAHGNYPSSKYFLIATPAKFFLWVNKSEDLREVAPDHIADAHPELEPYFREFGATPGNISGFLFEQIVTRWLKNIMYPAYREPNKPLPRWIVDSGLEKAVFHGDFQFEVAA